MSIERCPRTGLYTVTIANCTVIDKCRLQALLSATRWFVVNHLSTRVI